MRCAVPGTRRARVETVGRDGASGRSRSVPAGRDFTKSLSLRMHGLGDSARQHVHIHTRDAGLARGACAQQSAQLRGERIRRRDTRGSSPGHRGQRAVLRRLREPRQVLGGVFDDVETQAIETPEAHEQERGARVA